MAVKIELKRSSVPGKVPTTASLNLGELAINTYDGKVYLKQDVGFTQTILQLAGTPVDSGSVIVPTASYAYYAVSASYATSVSGGREYVLPVWTSDTTLAPSNFFQSGTYTALNYSGSPEDPNNPDLLYIHGAGVNTYNLISAHGDKDSYTQISVQNYNSGPNASSDIVATADTGDENQGYIDMGINGSNFLNVNAVGKPLDGYLYSTGSDLLIGNISPDKRVIIFAGGSNAETYARVYVDPGGTVGINTIAVSPTAPEALLVEAANNTTYNLITAKSNVNYYSQFNILNRNPGNLASADIVAGNDLGTETNYYVDMGINSSNHTYDPTYTVGGPNDTYLLSVSRNHYIGSSNSGNITIFTGPDFNGETNAKLILRAANNHEMTGSFNVSGSLSVNQGVINYLSASYALTASYVSSSISNAVSASYALTASYVANASSFPYTGSAIISGSLTVIGNEVVSGSLSITGSNTLIGTKTITGSVFITGSKTVVGTNTITGSFNVTGSQTFVGTAVNIGTVIQTGSFLVTGSTTQTGNNTLIGNTVLSGSIAISGSQLFTGVGTQIGASYFTGSMNITGSTTQTGNNRLIGNTILSGSIAISGSQGLPTATIGFFGDVDVNGTLGFLPVYANIDNSLSGSYIYVSGSTQDLYFSQNGAGYSNTTRLRWLEGNLYTGLLNGGLITTSSSTVYQVSSGSGIIVNLNASLNANPYPTIQYLNWGNLSQSIAPLSASYDQAFVSVDSTGNIFQQGAPFSDGQFNALINIGIVLFQNNSTINGVKTQPSVAYGFEQAQNVFNRAFGPLKLSGFTVAVSGSSTGSVVVGSGTAYSPGANYTVDPNNPYYSTDPGTNTSKFFRYYQSGSGVNPFVYLTNGGAGYPNLDPVYYDNSGTLDTVGTSNYSIQRLFWYPNSVTKAIVAYYGNARYGTMSEAIANLNIEPFVEAPNTAANAIYLGAYAIKGGTNTSLQNPAHFTWIPGGLFRSVGGSGGGGSIVTQTLAGLSDVSITGPTSLQPLAYNSTTLKWQNVSAISSSIVGNATTATTASYALSSSNSVSSSYAFSSSYALSSSNALTASYLIGALTPSGSFTGSFTGSLLGSASYALTASFVTTAQTASFVTASSISGTVTSASYALTASYATSSSIAISATTASYVTTAQTASYVAVAQTASHADTFTIGGSQINYSIIPSTSAGNNGIFAISTGSFTSAFYQYTISQGSNARSDNTIAVWTSATSSFTNYSTIDIGSTAGVVATVVFTGGQIQLNVLTPSGGWTVKAMATYL